MSSRKLLMISIVVCTVWSSWLTSCSAPAPKKTSEHSQAVHAQCLVCKSEGDLACVDVTIEEDTPRTELDGVTYYFCSTTCRKDFEKHPERYIDSPHAGK